mgnify:CR=1 FL=1
MHLYQSLKTLSNLGISANEYLNSDIATGRTGAKEVADNTIVNLATVLATNTNDEQSRIFIEKFNALLG